MEVGQEYRSDVIDAAFGRMLAFSGRDFDTPGWPAKNLHTDQQKAEEAGFPGPIASAIQAEAHAIRLLESVVGDAWFAGGVLNLKIVKPLFAGDTYVVRAVVRSKEERDKGTRYVFEIFAEKGNGEMAASGTAEVTMPAMARS